MTQASIRRIESVTNGAASRPRAADRAPVASLALRTLAIIAVIFLLREAQSVFIPLVLGVLISSALNPAVRALHRRRVPRAIGATLVLVLLIAGIGWGVWMLSDGVARLVNELPVAARQARLTLRDAVLKHDNPLDKMRQTAHEIERAASGEEGATPPAPVTPTPSPVVGNMLWYGSVGAVTAVIQIAVILFLVFFLLAAGDRYKRKVLRFVTAALGHQSISEDLVENITRQIERFLLARVLVSAVVGFATWVAFVLLGVRQAAVWGVAAGVLITIPYFGAIGVAIGAFIAAFMQFETLTMAFLVAGTSLVITSLEGLLVSPWVTGRATRLNTIAVFVGLVMWGWIWGVWGAILAVPILASIKAVCDRVEDTKPIGDLLGE